MCYVFSQHTKLIIRLKQTLTACCFYLVGTCAAPLWSSKCACVTTMGVRLGKSSGESADVIITKLFGFFFLLFQTAQIWGNLISSQVLKPVGKQNSYLHCLHFIVYLLMYLSK